jgi:hypothetical protein
MMNSYLSLVFPFVIMTFGVFFMRQVIMAIPDELLEARASTAPTSSGSMCASCSRSRSPA